MKFELYGESLKQEEISKCKEVLLLHKSKSIQLEKYLSEREESEYKKSLH
jgi:hypothetical protein